MAVGTTTAILLGLAGAGAAYGISQRNKPSGSYQPQPLPQAPSIEKETESAEETIKRRRASLSQTIFTSPLGIGGQAQVARKTLLGQ